MEDTTNTPSSFDVFLSHNKVDKSWVINLKEDLQRYGVSVWLDKDEIRPGDFSAKAREVALKNCQAIALIISQEAISSGWVEEEYYSALSPDKISIQIIPVILEEVELPGFLKSRTSIDFRDESLYAEKVRDLVWGITGTKPEQVLDLDSTDLSSPKETLQFNFDTFQYFEAIRLYIEQWFPIIPLSLKQESVLPDILSFTINVQSEIKLSDTSETLFDVLQQFRQITLVGEAGTGKSVSLWQLALSCNKNPDKTNLIPVYIELAGYNGEKIVDLIQRSFQMFGHTITTNAVITLAQQGHLLLLFDDFDISKTAQISNLLINLTSWKLTYLKCPMVITTHRLSDGHKLKLPTFRLLPLNYNEAQRILMELSIVDESDALAILNNLPEESKHLIDSPLTLRMIAYAYVNSKHHIPKSQGSLYQVVAEGIFALSEQKGFIEFEKSDKVQLIALLAKWMQDNEVYVISPAQLITVLSEWIRGKNNYPQLTYFHPDKLPNLRTEIIQSGFFRTRLDGDIEFIHSTFRAYFAALTISIEQLSLIVEVDSWTTSLIFWTSLNHRTKTDAIFDLILEDPILLGQIVIEREKQRNELIFNKSEVYAYFEKLNQAFRKFISQFPSLLRGHAGSFVQEAHLNLLVAESSTEDFTIVWRNIENDHTNVRWVTNRELLNLEKAANFGFVLPIRIIPRKIIQKYHPVELTYLLVMRSLFDILNFGGWGGGVDVMTFTKDYNLPHSIALIMNRFFLYQDFANKLPIQFLDKLPFYAQKEYDLAIEVHDYLDMPLVRYAIVPTDNKGSISIIQSVLKEPNDPFLFKKDGKGNWSLYVGESVQEVSSVEEVEVLQLMSRPPDAFAKEWLTSDFKKYFSGFPPNIW